KFEFTNIHCKSLDKDFMDMEECFLKSVNRTYKYMNVRTKIYKFPVNDVTVRVEVLKRLNGYKPFLFNFTVDACKFLKGQRNTLVQFFYELFSPYSNILHKCPYNVSFITVTDTYRISRHLTLQHDVYVNKLPISYLDYRLTYVLPFPEGVYCVHSIYSSKGVARMDLKVYVNI
ncbi:hypothetical protein KR009_006727, partial [Drosophila setifemur]